jgi:hypothetical protein
MFKSFYIGNTKVRLNNDQYNLFVIKKIPNYPLEFEGYMYFPDANGWVEHDEDGLPKLESMIRKKIIDYRSNEIIMLKLQAYAVALLTTRTLLLRREDLQRHVQLSPFEKKELMIIRKWATCEIAKPTRNNDNIWMAGVY